VPVLQQHGAEALEALVELLDAARPLAIAPGVLVLAGLGVPPDAAELADEVRLAGVG